MIKPNNTTPTSVTTLDWNKVPEVKGADKALAALFNSIIKTEKTLNEKE